MFDQFLNRHCSRCLFFFVLFLLVEYVCHVSHKTSQNHKPLSLPRQLALDSNPCDSPCCFQVLRRQQFAAKDAMHDAAEGGEGETSDKKQPKGKGKGRGRGKGKSKAKAKAKAEAKAEAHATQDTKADQEPKEKSGEAKDAKELPDSVGVSTPKDEVCPTLSHAPKDEQADISPPSHPAVAGTKPETSGDDAQVKQTKKRKPKVTQEPVDSAGSEPAKKKTKATKGDAKKNQPDTTATPVEKPKARKITKTQDDKKENAEKEPEKEKPNKRTRNMETQTFARRVVPTTQFGKDKWHALRGAFADVIRPTLKYFSAHEDMVGEIIVAQ